jgi:hypothetical protein
VVPALVAAVLLLGAYAASAPFVFFWIQHRLPSAIPTLQAVYAPLAVYSRHAEWPGSISYIHYQSWCHRTLQEYTLGPEDANRKLDELTQIQFSGSPLRDIVNYLSEVHGYPIELDDSADGDTELTANHSAPLQDALAQLLDPHGLVAAPDEGRIVIGTSAAIERIVAQRRAANPLHVWGPLVLGTGGTALVIAAVLLIRRIMMNRRRARPVVNPPTP